MGLHFTMPSTLTAMIEVYSRIDRLQGRLQSLGRQIEATYEYLNRADGNRALGQSHYKRLRDQWGETLVGLREARGESRRLLAAS